MGIIKKLFLLVFLIVLYIVAINFGKSVNFDFSRNNESVLSFSGADVALGFSAKAGGDVEAERFYGTIRSSHGSYTEKTIYFFDIIPLPFIVRGYDLKYYHLAMAVFLFILFISMLLSERRILR